MTANMAGLVEGDLPWLERERGGQRDWSAGGGGGGAELSRASSANLDRPDDFEALKAVALQGVEPRHRDHVVVLPPVAEVWRRRWDHLRAMVQSRPLFRHATLSWPSVSTQGESVRVVDVKKMDRQSKVGGCLDAHMRGAPGA